MTRDNGKSRLSQLLKIGLIALVAYFSQVYPYVHFHHTHGDEVNASEVISHPRDIEPHHSHHGHDHDDASHESSDNHHHHELTQHVDWFLVRTHTNSSLSHIDLDYVSVQTDQDPTPAPSQSRQRIHSTTLPESVPLDGVDPRGPPTTA
jgi:hypothetical protein